MNEIPPKQVLQEIKKDDWKPWLEHGMRRHAAIVAREMHKPCVVGTQNATRTFRDGDIIKVDATNGIVRKLNPLSNEHSMSRSESHG